MLNDLKPPALSGDSGFYFSGEDNLRITSFNGAAGVVLSIEGRFVTLDGHIVPFVEVHTPNTDRTSATSLITMGEGFLTNVQVRATTGTPTQGQCFVIVEIVRGRLGALQPLGTLIQGYVTATQRRAWPGMLLESSLSASGVIRSITGTDPAAGAEISETVPTGARWRLRALRVALTTDATVANRLTTLDIDDGTTQIMRIEGPAVIAASTTRGLNYGIGFPSRAQLNGNELVPLPSDVVLGAGFRIRTTTLNLQAGDNYAAPQLLVEEFIAG